MTAINNLISQRNSDTAALTDIEVHDIRLETADQCVHPIPTPVQLDISDTANEAVPSIQSHDPCAPVDESAVLPMSLVSRSPPIASSGSFYSFAEEEEDPSIGLETAAAQMRARFAHLHVSAEDFALDRDAAPSGIGGYGVVHKATRIRDGKICALKFFGYAKRDPASISVWDEIDVMNKLQQCPAMVKLEGYFEDTREGLLPGKKFPGSFPGTEKSPITSLAYIARVSSLCGCFILLIYFFALYIRSDSDGVCGARFAHFSLDKCHCTGRAAHSVQRPHKWTRLYTHLRLCAQVCLPLC